MTEFLNYWKNYANFSDRTTVKGYWMAFLFLFLSGIVVGLLNMIPYLGMVIYVVYMLAIIVPSLAICIRRLRDAGKPWTYIFFSLIPLAGFIIMIVFLCKASVPDDGTPVV